MDLFPVVSISSLSFKLILSLRLLHLEVRGINLSIEVRTSEASRFPFIPESRKRSIASI